MALFAPLLFATGARAELPVVPPPFAPVAVARAEDAYTVSVWGRSYRFERGPLPVAITSQGVALWAAPPRYELDLGSGPAAVLWSAPSPVEQRADVVRFTSSGRSGPLEIRAETRIEYDGMIRVDLTLRAEQSARVQRYAYELTFPAAIARSFNHHVPYDYEKLNVDKRNLIAAAGAFPETSRRFAFVPTMFVGNRSVGVEWWSETDAFWSGSGQGPLELGHRDGTAHLRVEPIAAPISLAAGETWSDAFALFPAPLRPPPPHWREYRFTTAWRQKQKQKQKAETPHVRRAWIAFPNFFEARWHGLPESSRNPKQEQLRAELRRNHTLYIPYGVLTATPVMNPYVMERSSQWSASGKLNTGAPKGLRSFLEARGQWKPGQPYAYAACMGRNDYLDWMLEQYLRAFREESLDGLYFDHAAISRMCTNDPVLKGREGKQVWEYFNVRNFYKRLYEGMKARNPDALLTIHTHGQPRALAAWADFTFIGEAWNVLFRGEDSWLGGRDRSSYDPDYFRLPEEYLEAQLLPRMGGITAVLPEVKHAVDRENPAKGQRYQRAFFARILPFDVPYWHTHSEATVLKSVSTAFDRFGPLDDAQVFAWWERRGVVPSSKDIVATSYARGGRALVVVANWSERPVDAELDVQRDVLGLGASPRARDAEGIEPAPRLAGGKLRVTVPGRDLRIVTLD